MSHKIVLSAEAFRRNVEAQAFKNWQLWRDMRARRDWLDACQLLINRPRPAGRLLSVVDIRLQAFLLHEERKAADALRDWQSAERDVGEMCTVY